MLPLSLVPYLTNTTVSPPRHYPSASELPTHDHKTVNHAVVARSRCCRGKQAEYVDGEDDGADGVVRVVGHVHRGEGVWGPGRHRHLEDKQEMAHIHDNAAGCPSGTHSR